MYQDEPLPDPRDEYWELVKAGKEPKPATGGFAPPTRRIPQTPTPPNETASPHV